MAEGADPNAHDPRDGTTALHWATVVPGPRSARTIGVLLRRGANPFAPDAKGRTPEEWAHARHNTGALAWFRSRHTIASAQRRSQSGFTLIELTAALGLMTVVSAAVFGLFSGASDSAKLVQAQSGTSALVESIVRSYASSGSFAALTTESAIAENWLPDEVRGSNGRPVNAWGNPITLNHMDYGQPSAGLTITQNVPASACATFVAKIGTSFDTVRVNGSDVRRTSGAIDPSSAGFACDNVGDAATVMLISKK